MKIFITKTGIFICLFLLVAESLSRLIIDPYYYYHIDTYNKKKEDPSISDIYSRKKTKHVDYLFIGSSRVPATINPAIFMEEDETKTAVVAGRGYMTAGIHYQALMARISKYPDYLKGAQVFIEYPGSGVYTNPFTDDKLTVYEPTQDQNKPMPHLLLPHLNFQSLLNYLHESNNSLRVRLNLAMQYMFSSFRSSIFIKEKVSRLSSNYLLTGTANELAAEGGIRNDNMDNARALMLQDAAYQREIIADSPALSYQDLELSSLENLFTLITHNGGTLYLYEVPLTSIQENIYSSDKAARNKSVFERWSAEKGIEIISMEQFRFNDSDFPDGWHLSIDRRDEFSSLLYQKIIRRALPELSDNSTY